MNKNKFYNSSHTRDLEFIPFDIESTGFEDDAIITTFTLLSDDTYTVWVNTDGRDANPDLEDTVKAEANMDISLRIVQDEGNLLRDIRRFIMGRINKERAIFVAYNGEVWNGGYDIRAIRSRCLANGAPFLFSGYAYTDLMPVFGKHDRFNVTHKIPDPDLGDIFTTGPLKQFGDFVGAEYKSSWNKPQIEEAIESEGYTEEMLDTFCDANGHELPRENPSSLVPVYERIARLMDWDDKDVDPFGPDESKKAVHAFHEGDFESVILHNLADVHKTGKLMDMVVNSLSVPKNEYEPTFFPSG